MSKESFKHCIYVWILFEPVKTTDQQLWKVKRDLDIEHVSYMS